MKRMNLLITTLALVVTTGVAGSKAHAGETDLGLFAKDAQWKFEKNTGEGSFELATDGELPIGVMNYDFSKSPEAKSGKYVLAIAATEIAEGAQELHISVRTSRAQKLTFRVNDATGQTHQYKTQATGSGDWQVVRIPLNKKLEHWGGANDGKVNFPVKSLTLSVPAPGAEPLTGKVEYAKATVVTN